MSKLKFVLFLFICYFILSSCRDRIQLNTTGVLNYSADTILFDTVFTDQGTRTLQFKIYNRTDGKIIIDRLYTDKQSKSSYIINADGEMLRSELNLELLPSDSMYLFVQVKLKEQGADTVLQYSENLLIDYNGMQDRVPMICFGQDVRRIYGQSIGTEIWSGRKPYLLYDSLHIQKGQSLTIEEGVTVYCHAGAKIIAEGELHCNGTLEAPITFKSDNLDTTYNDIPLQWGSIVLKDNTGHYSFNYTNILRGTNGILAQFDTYDPSSSIQLENVKIQHVGYGGIIVHNANVSAVNLLSVNNSGYGISISGNGNHSFIHSTFAKDQVFRSKGFKYVKVQDSLISDQLQIFFGNSILTGTTTQDVAFEFPDDSISNWNIEFKNCAVSIAKDNFDQTHFTDCALIQDTSRLFTYDSGFMLDSASVARNIGSISVMANYVTDIRGTMRNVDLKPDAGAIEYKKDSNQ